MDKQKHLAQIRQRFTLSISADSDNRIASIADQEFVFGGDSQWDKEAQEARKGRPMLTANKMPKFIRQITGDQRQNKPSAKVHPVDSAGDPMIAKIFEGHIKNIEYNSSAAQAYDEAFKQACTGGYPGFWRVTNEYAADDTFDQDIFIRPIHNQYTVYPDPETVLDVYQGKLAWCFITETVREETFKEMHPREEGAGWEQGTGEDYAGWWMDGEVRVAEYYYQEPVKKLIYLLEDNSVIEAEKVKMFVSEGPQGKMLMTPDGQQQTRILKERNVGSHRIMWCKVGGGVDYLEKPREWPGRYIPVVPVFGDTWVINGRVLYKSAIRDGKDPQKAYNYVWSQNVEMAALAPKVPFMLTPKQIEGHERHWGALNTKPFPYALYNPDAQAPGAPQRSRGAEVNPAYVQLAQQANMDIDDTIGIFKSAYGAQGNETSGIAIQRRQQESDTSTFEFIDNLHRAVEWTYKILVDMIPRIYDGERTIRTLGPDDTPQQVAINKSMPDPENPGGTVLVNDITVGKYDVRVSIGPSFTTQRAETAAAMEAIVQAAPQIAPIIIPEWIRMMDWPNAQEMSQQIKEMMAPGQDPMQTQMMELEAKLKVAEIALKEASAIKTETASILDLANAESKTVSDDVAVHSAQVNTLSTMHQMQQPPKQPATPAQSA